MKQNVISYFQFTTVTVLYEHLILTVQFVYLCSGSGGGGDRKGAAEV